MKVPPVQPASITPPNFPLLLFNSQFLLFGFRKRLSAEWKKEILSFFLAVRNQADNDIYFLTTSGAEQLFSPSLTLTCDPDVPGRDALCQRCAEEGGGGGGGESALV